MVDFDFAGLFVISCLCFHGLRFTVLFFDDLFAGEWYFVLGLLVGVND